MSNIFLLLSYFSESDKHNEAVASKEIFLSGVKFKIEQLHLLLEKMYLTSE